ncbi:MAG: glycosyltransferase [Candidatus Nitricoxidivorans perseverans]|uniref:Glycosyltransferase n=1 Tax=Candidatus Nitricoxidivorans perseverans TaxID=2975601 RepID=A0AA49IXL4_9PROT|nr:MAG: glycosyltransferase [Candidatus Nitricoxidivorans perseverans]
MNNSIAVVIPTKDRPDDLRTMLASLGAQTRRPDQVIVVDGSDPDIRHVVEAFPELGIDYVRVFPPSLSRQRNAGMARLREGISLAGYLDDDLVLEPEAVERMMSFWEGADSTVGGAAFSITNFPAPRHVPLKSLFWIDSAKPGRVLPSGVVSSLMCEGGDLETDWLCGGATIWRREVIDTYRYDEWYQGTGFLEDVDYSFSVRERYRLFLVASARLAHYSHPVRPERQFLLGKWQIVNRMRLVRKFRSRGLSPWKSWVASVALTALNFGQALVARDGQYLNRARGNFAGLFSELSGRREQIGGHLK